MAVRKSMAYKTSGRKDMTHFVSFGKGNSKQSLVVGSSLRRSLSQQNKILVRIMMQNANVPMFCIFCKSPKLMMNYAVYFKG